MKEKKKFLGIVIALVTFLLLSCFNVSAASTVKIARKGTKQLTIKGAGIKSASSSNKAVASVTKSGKVTAKKAGTATVTLKDTKNKIHKYKIVVENTYINKKTLSIKQGAKYQLKLKNTTQKVKWSTNKKSVATVSAKGVVTGKKPGKVTITARVANGPAYKCVVTVKKVKPTLTALTASQPALMTGMKTSVTFSVKASASVTGKIQLYNSRGKTLAVMLDNGKSGDSKKGDGIYSCTISVKKTGTGSLSYYAKAKNAKSSKVTLYVYTKPDATAKVNIQTVEQQFEKISEKYENSSGTMSAENAAKSLKEAAAYAKKQVAGGKMLRYEVNSDNVVCKMKSGLTVVYQPEIAGIDSIGKNVSMKIVTMQPCLSMYGSSLNNNMKLPDNAATTIASEFSNYSFSSSDNLDNSSVSLERIKQISSNQVVIWHGHGGYSKSLHSFLVTGEEFDWNKWMWDVGYWMDCVQNRIVESSNGRAMITSKFISKYCGNMNNTMIYLAACCSGKDDVLATAFLNKGASAVVANSETIYTTYNTRMENAVLTNMASVNSATNNYYTLEEALNAAKSRYGSNDGSEHHATPLIFGGTTARNYRFGDVRPGKLEGSVSRADDHSVAISGASISVMKNGSVVKKTVSDSRGEYSIEAEPGTYEVAISASGYIGYKSYVTVESGKTKYMETFLMVDGSENEKGTANGYIKNALTGQAVSGVKIEFRKDWNNTSVGPVVKTVYTNTSGWYSLELQLGNYTATISKEGFVTTSFNIVVLKQRKPQQNSTISPFVSGETWQIVLEWGENPRDLDSHVVGTLSNGSSFHTYYSRKSAWENGIEVCNLDVDDRYSYGPETITLKATNTTPYYYYVYNYAGTGTLATSGAKVTVLKGGSKVATYNVPVNQGSGRYWNIFAIVDGRLIIKNTVTSSADVSYATSSRAVGAYLEKSLVSTGRVAGTEEK